MRLIPTAILDVILIEPNLRTDPRGYFLEWYNQRDFAAAGIPCAFVQDNHSCSKAGVLRGLHYQAPPRAQAKLIRVIRGEIFDVAVDIRHGSATLGQFVTATLSAENKRGLFIPAGFAHGYCALQDNTEVLYKVSDYYSPEHERGLIWNDPALAIPWPKLNVEYLISEKDRRLPPFKDLVDNPVSP